jgi:hypothetical protein
VRKKNQNEVYRNYREDGAAFAHGLGILKLTEPTIDGGRTRAQKVPIAEPLGIPAISSKKSCRQTQSASSLSIDLI